MKNFTGVIVLFFVFGAIPVFAQVGPSVSAGIDKIAYQKGELDADVIVDIVSTKKEEVRRELATRLLLERVECGSFTTWNFIRRSIDLLLTERKEGVLKKEMLRNVAELAMVVGVSEFYLQSLQRKSQHNTLNDSEKAFLLQYFRWTDIDSKKHLDAFMPLQADVYNGQVPNGTTHIDISHDITNYYLIIDLYQVLAKTQTYQVYENHKELFNPTTAKEHVSTILTAAEFNHTPTLVQMNKNLSTEKKARGYLPGTILLASLRNRNSDEVVKRRKDQNPNIQCDCDLISPNQILIDLVFDICRKDDGVLDLDLFHNVGVSDEEYRKNSKLFTMPDDVNYGATREGIEHIVHFLFKNSTALGALTESVLTSDKKKVREYIKKELQALGGDTTLIRSTTLHKRLDKLERDFRRTLASVRSDLEGLDIHFSESSENTAEGASESLAAIYNFTQRTFPDINFDYVFYDLEYDIMPLIVDLNSAVQDSGSTVKASLTKLDSLRKYAKAGALLDMWREYDSLQMKTDFSKFALLIDVVNNYDKVEYYDMLIKFIGSLGNLYTNNNAAKIVSHFATGFDKYTALNSDDETLDFDVESMAVDLYDRFAKNNSSRLSMYFTVGINYGKTADPFRTFQSHELQDLDSHDAIKSKVKTDTGEDFKPINSVNFVSEKIGIKFKLLDRSRRYSFGPWRDTLVDNESVSKFKRFRTRVAQHKPARNPFLTDVHLIAYGSGILYNIKHLSTESTFNKPSYGFAAGVTFFNGLDFNLGYAVPFGDKFDLGFFNASFDIAFTEYLSALKKKNR